MSFAHSLHESFTWVSPRMEVAMIVTVYRMCTKASMKRGSCVGVNVVVLDARKQPPSSRRAMTNIVNIINSSSEARFPFHNLTYFGNLDEQESNEPSLSIPQTIWCNSIVFWGTFNGSSGWPYHVCPVDKRTDTCRPFWRRTKISRNDDHLMAATLAMMSFFFSAMPSIVRWRPLTRLPSFCRHSL